MEAMTKDQAKAAIESYYKEHMATGVEVDVSGITFSEAEGGGKLVHGTVAFIKQMSGAKDAMKVTIPCDDKHNMDWTNITIAEEKETHAVSPDKASHPAVKSPEPLPANNDKPKDGGGQPPEKVKYIQKPKKVGSAQPKKGESKKTIKHPKVLGYDKDGWPTPDQIELDEKNELRRRQMEAANGGVDDGGWSDDLDPIPEHGGGGDDFDVFQEAGIDPATATRMLEAKAGGVAPKLQPTTDGYVFDQDTEEVDMRGIKGMTERDGQKGAAIVEFVKKVDVPDTDASLFEMNLLFEDEETRNEVKAMLEGVSGVDALEENDSVGLVIASRQDSEHSDPTTPLAMITEATGLAFMHDDDSNGKKLDEAIEEGEKAITGTGSGSTHSYSDNSGAYHKGVQTDANEPGAAMGAGAKETEPEQGGPKKRKHKGTQLPDQGGDGLGGASSQSAPSTKISGGETSKAGQQESLEEQEDFLDDVMGYQNGEEEMGGEDDEMGDEMDDMNGNGGEIDDSIMSLVAAQAEHGIEIVLQVAEETMGELSPEQVQEIRDMYADIAAEGGEEEEDDMAVASMEVTAVGDVDDDENSVDSAIESVEEDVTVNVGDGGSASVNDGGTGDEPAAAPEPPAEATPEPAPAADPEPEETPADGDAEEETTDDDEEADTSGDESDDKGGEGADESDAPTEEEAVESLRSELVDELTEMEEEDAASLVSDLTTDDLLELDEQLPPPGEGGRFKKLKKDLGDEGAEDPGGLAAYIGRKKYGKKKFQNMAARGEGKKSKGKKLGEETPISGMASRVAGWAANQPAPGDNLSFTPDGAYSFKQRIAKRDPKQRVANVLKPGKFSPTTSRHSNMVARGLAQQGYRVNRVDAIGDDTAMGIGQVNTAMGLGLPAGAMESLSSARFDQKKLEKLSDEQKGQLKEKLLARAKKLSEDQQNPNTMGGPQTWQRVRGKKKSYNMFGRLKPDTKWKGMVRVVWDDGNESWEQAGDLQNVGANPYNVKSPSGGPTKPAANNMTQQGGETYDMLKSLESLKKLSIKERFEKIVALKLEGKELPEDKVVECLTHDWDEFDAMTESLAESLKVRETEADPEPEPITEDDDDKSGVRLISEDMGDEQEIVEISDEDLDEDDE